MFKNVLPCYKHKMHLQFILKSGFLAFKAYIRKKLILERLNIVIIEIFKFQKMHINMHDGSNIHNTSCFE